MIRPFSFPIRSLPVRGFSRAFLLLAPLAVTSACGQGPTTPHVVQAAALRPRDPELDPVRVALEGGRPDQALLLLEGFEGFEAGCLRARAQAMNFDLVAALRSIEEARRLAPDHPELYATEAEVLAGVDRLDGAAAALEAGYGRCGRTPELERARGVVHLRHSGQAGGALEALERARALDPGLPFLAWPLAQAHLLVGRSLLQDSPGEALAHARAAQRIQEGLVEALELEAEAHTGALDYESALEVYGALTAQGHGYGETPAILHQRCATRLLIEHRRAEAVQHYLAARALGMGDEGLGFGLDLLQQEARAALDQGIVASQVDDWEAARAGFERALELEPTNLEAENHLAVARFHLGDYAGAAQAWEGVWSRARSSALVLPDPVPLNLARAWRLAQRPDRARRVLEGYLDTDPEGPWNNGARDLLLALEAEALESASAR